MNRTTIQTGIDAFKTAQLPNSNVLGTNLLIENMVQATSTHKIQTVLKQGMNLVEMVLSNTLTKEDDLANNLTTDNSAQALTASQGVAIKVVLDDIIGDYGQANGTARLDGSAIVPQSQLPQSSITLTGVIRLATVLEANELTSGTVALSPLTLPTASVTQRGTARFATALEATAGILTNVMISPATLGAITGSGVYAPVIHDHTSSQITDFSAAVTQIINTALPLQTALTPMTGGTDLAPIIVNTTTSFGFDTLLEAEAFFIAVQTMSLRVSEIEDKLQALALIA